MTEEFQKLPPHNLMAEKALLGGLLINGEAIVEVLEVLRGDEFYLPGHQRLFATMLELFEKALPIDMVTVTDHLKSDDGLKKIGGSSYLVELTREVGDAANVAHYARIVAKKAILRGLINASVEVESRCYDPSADEEEVLDAAQAAVFSVVERGIKQAYITSKDLMKASIEEVVRARELKSPVTGIPTNYKKMDEMTGGFQNADLIIIAGRPSMGKTAFALNLACNAAMSKDHDPVPVAFFSLEMSKEQLGMRLISAVAGVDSRDLRAGFVEGDSWSKTIWAADKLSEAPIFIDDTAAISNLEVRAKARRLKQEHGLGLVIIDYLQLMRFAGRAERRELEISEISRSLKGLAKELNIPVIALSQLSRKPEDRQGGKGRPQLSDLRESGALEQDADVVIFLYRPWYYMGEKEREEASDNERTKLELIIGKQRNGPTGTVLMTFIERHTRFSEPVKDEFEEAF